MRRLATAFAGILLALSTAATAQPQAGKQYRVLSEPQPSDTDKPTVIEFFSYACPHCHSFHPIIDDWANGVADSVEVLHVPVTFGRDSWKLLARAYYVAKALEVTDKTHGALFAAIHNKGFRASSKGDIADLYADVGVDREEVMDAFDSFVVDMKVKRAAKMVRNYGVRRTPTMAVGGRYVTDPTSAGGQEAMLNVVDYLLAEKVGSKGSARSASGGASDSEG
jgi:thiol:disulfide interchange protein DsbA